MSTRHPTRARLVGGRYAVDGRLLRAGVALDAIDLAADGRRVRVRALAGDEPAPTEALARLRDGDLDVVVVAAPRGGEPAAGTDVVGTAPDPPEVAPGRRRRRVVALALVAAVVAGGVVHGVDRGGGAASAPPAAAASAAAVRLAAPASAPRPRPRRRASPPARTRPVARRRRAAHVVARRRATVRRAPPPPVAQPRAPVHVGNDAPPAASADGEVPPAG